MSMVMLLIDADNVSADVIEQAVQRTLADQGAIHVRRAYCNAETALKQQALFKRLSVRPMVNLAAGKNCTDIALAVDAMDLVVTERPDLVVLVSSDSDFAPLVIRLREKGCRVCGIGQQGKTGEDTVAVYDSFIDLQHQAAGRPAAAKRPARGRRAKAQEAAPPAPVLPDDVLRILDAVPELLRGDRVELNHAAERLRGAKLLGKSASSPKLFKKFPELFSLTPQKTPNKVQYVGPAVT
ncbi:NYN domain protein [Variovorax sp. PBS-H4]|uniref:NYN domain-containing protein n=1 Tax=Variovorax sp. PBS-H4 TaxID=434008 RepID=UPI0013192F12|nr:NYN domain-containing protein [Variovorax sp. PBS-H4]VTU21956.1 NYN domain protein [Variovorax sp. PBS-H4]